MANSDSTKAAVDQNRESYADDAKARRSLLVGSTGNPNSASALVFISTSDNGSIDAFGRFRTSHPLTLFDSKQIFDNQPLFWDDQEVSGSGTSSTHSTAEARSRLAVSATTAGKRVRQTFMRFNYQPGKSQLIFLTAVMNDATNTGIKACVGMFDDDNGIFFCNDSGTLKAVRRTSVTGSAVDNEVSQSSWNLDTMDGNGASGVTLDPTKSQIMVIDFEWLGVGRVRMGFVVDGAIIYAHQFLNTNNLSVVYMSTPNLPLRYSLENDGTGDATTMDHICSTVISEGGSQDLGVLRYKSTGGTHIDANTQNTIYAIIGIRLKSTHLGATIKLVNTTIAEHQGNKNYEWMLIFNPTVAGTFTYSNETNSSIQTATGATANTVTGGTIITGGYASSAQKGGITVSSEIENALLLGSAIDGTPDEIVLCVRPVGGSANIDIEGAITWREAS